MVVVESRVKEKSYGGGGGGGGGGGDDPTLQVLASVCRAAYLLSSNKAWLAWPGREYFHTEMSNI